MYAFHVIMLALLLPTGLASPKRSNLGRGLKRTLTVASPAEKLMQLVRKAGELLHIVRPQFVYHMDDLAEKHALVDLLWTGDYSAAIGRFTASNLNLVSLFEQQGIGDAEPTRFHKVSGTMPRFESVLVQHASFLNDAPDCTRLR